MAIEREYVFRNKFKAVAAGLRGATGKLLDVGARDRVLSRYLDLKKLTYFSADLGDGHDFRIDLERPLSFADGEFDYVVALDVLEHVENIHGAFHEFARISKRGVIVALPNVATLRRRVLFVCSGRLGTDKYDLLPQPRADRHRWLTVYSQMNEFILFNADRAGLFVRKVIEEMEGGAVQRLVGYGLTRLHVVPVGWFSGRSIYFMEQKRDSAGSRRLRFGE
jgi:hypothetical protein